MASGPFLALAVQRQSNPPRLRDAGLWFVDGPSEVWWEAYHEPAAAELGPPPATLCSRPGPLAHVAEVN